MRPHTLYLNVFQKFKGDIICLIVPHQRVTSDGLLPKPDIRVTDLKIFPVGPMVPSGKTFGPSQTLGLVERFQVSASDIRFW